MNLSQAQSGFSRRRGGFTLTELLVATALTVVIMLMFAQMYSSAVSSIRTQRGLARNDQTARSLTVTFRDDLQSMTYRQPSAFYGNVRGITPLFPGDTRLVDPEKQRGYFYYSENDPRLDFDDVLQFTVMANNGDRGDAFEKNQKRPYVGRASNLGVDNEPESDDGVDGDGLGSSRAAEVTYFMRHGNLYRRVLLLRDPLSGPVHKLDQPSNNGVPVFSQTAAAYQSADHRSSFWNDFDYAAFPARVPSADGAAKRLALRFHTLGSLNNTQGLGNSPLGLPHFRYGFDYLGPDALDESLGMGTGRPREYDSNGRFIGRLTLSECTKVVDETPTSVAPAAFQDTVNDYAAVAYPGDFLAGGFPNISNPFAVTTPLQDTNGDGGLDVFGAVPDTGNGHEISSGGGRASEDLLLPNVEAFNVRVWDDLAGAYVNIGGAEASRFSVANNQNPTYLTGSGGAGFANTFDTWHPSANSSVDLGGPTGFGTLGQPPYRPVVVPVSSLLKWLPNQTFTTTNNLKITDVTTDSLANPPALYGAGLIYRCVSVGSVTGLTGSIKPEFPPVPGTIVRDGDIVWQCTENRVGVRGIEIQIRYRDGHTNSTRQLTIVHSFVE